MLNFYKQLASLNENAISVSIVKGAGLGSKAIWNNKKGFIYQQGEREVLKKFEQALEYVEKNQIITLDNSTAFCEFISNESHLIICGAGHISIPLIKIAKIMGFKITVIDDRVPFANNALQAEADNVLCWPFAEALDMINGSSNHFFVILTGVHKYDHICLSRIIKKQHAYIGIIGRQHKVKKFMGFLEKQGVKKELLAGVHSPIGLKIGAQTPPEIAVAILAEIIKVKSQSKTSFGYPKNILEPLISPELNGVPKSLVTIISRQGSVPRDVGTKMLVMFSGLCFGTIGGGCVEAEICSVAKQTAEDKIPRLLKINLSFETAEDKDLVCDRTIEVYIEPVTE